MFAGGPIPDTYCELASKYVLSGLTPCRIKHYTNEEALCASCTGLRQDHVCPLDFQIGTKLFDDRETAPLIVEQLA
jgi:hypothetical protein